MNYTQHPQYRYYERRQEERASRKVAKADLPFLQEIPDPYEIDDAVVEDEFAVFKGTEGYYVDEAGNNGESYDQDFYVAMMIGWNPKEYQKYLEEHFQAKRIDRSMYFDSEEQAIKAMSWVASMRTLAKMSGQDILTIEVGS